MINTKTIICFLVCASTLVFACTKNNDNPSAGNGNSSSSTVITGNFIVTKFTDENSSEDKTADFAGYKFSFNTNNTITAVRSSVSVQGNYSEKPAHEGEGAKLTISFSDAPLNELNKNWQVDLISNSAIHLSDDDASSGEVLEFSAQ